MEDIKVISFATGTKCINGEHISMIGANLNDCHAEIISRRCLKDFFYTNLEYHITGQQDARIFCPHEEEVERYGRHPNQLTWCFENQN
ncbi:double-stranded RNA-specific editase 1 [Caerostris extrusa]|uniref:Double-stranded RNA-specific editase 1 n=1 Tax=Caerostris extrusa TaxID=172846 RepID=A0AAV4XKN0_CAEEX|nr:double-stranded RNA-specific editase 1 [Caerostris extrusa]